MPLIRTDLMTDAFRAAFEFSAVEDRFNASRMDAFRVRTEFERLVREVRWHEGEQTRDGYGPVGKCLVAWVDAYPLIVQTDPSSDGFYDARMSGHMSCGGHTVAGVMLNMLWRVARHPDGRRESDSEWLRRGGKKGFFEFYNANPKSDPGRTLEDLQTVEAFAPTESPLTPGAC